MKMGLVPALKEATVQSGTRKLNTEQQAGSAHKAPGDWRVESSGKAASKRVVSAVSGRIRFHPGEWRSWGSMSGPARMKAGGKATYSRGSVVKCEMYHPPNLHLSLEISSIPMTPFYR